MMNRIDPTNDRKFYGCSQNGGCRGFVGTDTGATSFSMTIPGAAEELGRTDRVRAPTRSSCSAAASPSTG